MRYLLVTDFRTSEKGLQIAAKINNQLLKEPKEVFRIHLEKVDEYQKCLAYLYKIQPEIIITIDMAGFHLTDSANEIIYNKLYAENHHLLTSNFLNYSEALQRRMSYPSTIYTENNQEINIMKEFYPHIYHILDSSYIDFL